MSEVTPIYLYRRKGQPAWATCDAERYEELCRAVHLFDTEKAYSASDYDALAAEFKDLAERYAKLQIGEDGVVARVVAERDAALAELAALKGGQGAVKAGDSRELSDIGNEVHNLSCHIVHVNEDWGYQLGRLASELWGWDKANPTPQQPGQDLVGLVEALRIAANRLDRLTLEVPGGYWREEAAEWTEEARAALAAHDKQSGGEV